MIPQSGRLIAAFASLLLSYQAAAGQGLSSGRWGMDIRGGYGFMIAHREALLRMQEAHLGSAEFAVYRKTNGKNDWERQFLLPEEGIQLEFINPGSPDFIGKVTALYPYVDFPLSAKDKRLLWLRYGLGLGYTEKIFDPLDNYKNAAIGSHLNGVLHLELQLRTPAGKQGAVIIGLGLTHLSNGGTRMPNLGINLPKATIGYRHDFGQVSESTKKTDEARLNPAGWQCYLAGGIKEIYPALGPKYLTSTANLTYLFRSQRKSRFGLGTDLFYDESIAIRQERLSGINRPSADFRPGITGVWQLRLGAIGIGFNMGFYPYTQYKEDGNFYHRIGLRYHFGNLFICSNLKTHYAKADFVEWGIGWDFTNKAGGRR